MPARPPYICKRCAKEMYSLAEVVEDWRSTDIYCQQCDPDRSGRAATTAPRGAGRVRLRRELGNFQRGKIGEIRLPSEYGNYITEGYGVDVVVEFKNDSGVGSTFIGLRHVDVDRLD